MEFEPALVKDIKEKLEDFASKNMKSHHSDTWGDDNGFSPIRATFMGPGITVPNEIWFAGINSGKIWICRKS